jgi:hypothetical protein
VALAVAMAVDLSVPVPVAVDRDGGLHGVVDPRERGRGEAGPGEAGRAMGLGKGI